MQQTPSIKGLMGVTLKRWILSRTGLLLITTSGAIPTPHPRATKLTIASCPAI
ncbi:Uncharacterised protein [Vibrio cholerae]|nr:Uncharacterised protein [Vibrio cholerae]